MFGASCVRNSDLMYPSTPPQATLLHPSVPASYSITSCPFSAFPNTAQSVFGCSLILTLLVVYSVLVVTSGSVSSVFSPVAISVSSPISIKSELLSSTSDTMLVVSVIFAVSTTKLSSSIGS